MDAFATDTDLMRRLLEYSELLPAQIAKRAGVSPSTIARPLNGTATTRLGRNVLDKLKGAFPEFPGWEDHPISIAPSATAEDQTVEVGSIDLRFGLGAAIMDEEVGAQQLTPMRFPRDWLRMITTSPANQLYWARGQGNSMEPAIGDGDVILIDRSQASLSVGDLYWAFAYGQTGMVKRLRQMPDGSVKILSDNPSVAPEIAYDGELNIYGRVIAVVRQI